MISIPFPKDAKFSRKRTFVTSWWAYRGNKCLFFGKFCVFRFHVTLIFWFTLLPYYREIVNTVRIFARDSRLDNFAWDTICILFMFLIFSCTWFQMWRSYNYWNAGYCIRLGHEIPFFWSQKSGYIRTGRSRRHDIATRTPGSKH